MKEYEQIKKETGYVNDAIDYGKEICVFLPTTG